MAAETTEEPQVEVEESTEETTESRGSFLSSKKIKILGLLFLVMGVEAAGFYLLVPQNPGTKDEEAADDEDDVETVEVTVLSNYGTVNHNAAPGVATDVRFTLVAEVPKNQATVFDLAVKKDRAGLIQNEVRTIIMGSNAEELHDPSLTVISQKIKEAINKALRKSYVTRVLFVKWTTSPR